MPEFQQLPPLSLYIHIPWCVRKCPYCDFNSHTVDELPEQQYIQELINDLEQQLPSIWGRRIVSVFIGGGTPSLFSGDSIRQLTTAIKARLNCLPAMEITLEDNPGTVEQQRFDAYVEAGVNRLSIGVQSFNSQHLKSLGRIHTNEEAQHAIEAGRSAGFENINLDLMFGLPDQSIEQGLEDLQQAIALQPQHISWYQLTIEPNTLFYKQPPPLPEDDLISDLQEQGQALLAQHGYQQYEISAYAQQGKRCRHNLNYWEFGDYLAIGAGAHGKISSAQDGSIRRYWQQRQPNAYLQASHKTSGEQWLTRADRVYEFMLNALRLKQGIELSLFSQHTGLKDHELHAGLNKARELELITEDQQRLIPTDMGYRFLNNLINCFHPEHD